MLYLICRYRLNDNSEITRVSREEVKPLSGIRPSCPAGPNHPGQP